MMETEGGFCFGDYAEASDSSAEAAAAMTKSHLPLETPATSASAVTLLLDPSPSLPAQRKKSSLSLTGTKRCKVEGEECGRNPLTKEAPSRLAYDPIKSIEIFRSDGQLEEGNLHTCTERRTGEADFDLQVHSGLHSCASPAPLSSSIKRYRWL
ncbi:hypothetical protein SAY87_031241 [Trapa incisa]|uniref:Uncharacterized protein n=1 Tax=Trapa incisa TaxID=236973 RepID=A0AAN7KQS9_9MYRT|nr:hypothetical protein SAY87_031241 [Trapa incisa]